MRRFSPMICLIALIIALPLLADEPPPEQKPGSSPSKPTPKEAPKPPATPQSTPQYQVVNKLVGKITKIDLDEMKLFVDAQTIAPSSSGKKLTPKTVKEEIKMSSDVKVRALKLPERFDENHKPKPYTEDEKKRLKGDPKLPGYTAELSNLVKGQHVEVHMAIRKAAPGSPKNKDKDVATEKPFAIMIVCTLEEPAQEKPEKTEKKAKKK